jgi:hypothetical protein
MRRRRWRGGSDFSAGVNFTPVPDADNPNHQPLVLEGADDSIISNAVFPEITQRPLQSFADFPGIVQFLDPPQEFKDSVGPGFVELPELLEGVWRSLRT